MKQVLFFSFLLLDFGAVAQQQNLKFEHIESDAGLMQSDVTCILQDYQGFMWFGTRDGLNKFDGYQFTVFKKNNRVKNSLSNDYITDLIEDAEHNVWIATFGGGLNLFIPGKQLFFHFNHDTRDATTIASDILNRLFIDSKGNLWIGTDKGLDMFTPATKKFVHYVHSKNDAASLSNDHVQSIFEDSNHDIWVGTLDGGVNLFDVKNKSFVNFKHDRKDSGSLGSNTVSVIFRDDRNQLWMGTRGGGLNLFNPKTRKFKNYKNDPKSKNSLSHDVILSIAQDNESNLWIGTENGGLSIFNPRSQTFFRYVHDDIDKSSLSNNSVWSISKDNHGNMWLGIFNGGINLFSRDQHKFTHYRHTSSPESLSHNSILSLYEDREKNLWVGTDGGGLNLFDRTNGHFKNIFGQRFEGKNAGNYVLKIIEAVDGKLWIGTWGDGVAVFDRKRNELKYFKHDPADAGSLGSNNAWTIFEDSEKNIWIGTYSAGLDLYDQKKQNFVHFRHNPADPSSISGDDINTILEDREGKLVIGTNGNGLNMMNKQTRTFTHFVHDDSATSLANDIINCLSIDRGGRMLIGTDFGLSVLDLQDNKFTNYHEADGLPNERIFGVLEDEHHILWISSNKGLSSFNPATSKVRNFTTADGLQSNQFKPAFCSSSSGKMYFGGINGFNEFHPDSIKVDSWEPAIVLTGFEIFNTPFFLTNEKNANGITLDYKQSVISFEFASLNYTSPDYKQYSYLLEGFDQGWNYVGTRHVATYTNLDPGTYTLTIRGLNNEGNWSKNTLSVAISIKPPFWKTWWFQIIMVALGLGCLGAVISIRERVIRKQKLSLVQQVAEKTNQLILSSEEERLARKEAEKARMEAEHANQAKSIFLATMSHEIRTPMNGVIGMASLLSETSQTTEQQEYTETIKNCGESLLTVINDILDFSKIESGKMELEQIDFDLRNCLEEVLDVFAQKAALAGLDLVYEIDSDVPSKIIGDRGRLRQVILNLVGNAIKFTHQGEIFVGVHLLKKLDGELVELGFEIRDSGIGIPKDKIDRLFKAFSQVDSSTTRKYGGTGLGLVICEKIVGLMGGSIQVESQLGKGATFTFIIQVLVSQEPTRTYIHHNISGLDGKKVLIVDDNETNRNILKNQMLRWKLLPTLADSGEEALAILGARSDFDLVLSDMQMPAMDGLSLARLIKKIQKDIPIILLTSVGDDRKKEHAEFFASVLTKPVRQSALFDHIVGQLIERQPLKTQPDGKIKLSTDFGEKHPLRILIVEDNPVNQRLAERVLNKLGYTAAKASNGQEALDVLDKNSVDLILMDVQMPVMDGFEATRQIRLRRNLQPVIVAMTANAMQGDREECLQAGMNDYISKPIILDDLVKMLEKWSVEIQMKLTIKG